MAYNVTTNNAFHDGWMAALLGLDTSAVPHADGIERSSWFEGYDMALDTPSVRLVSEATRAMRTMGQLVVVPKKERY